MNLKSSLIELPQLLSLLFQGFHIFSDPLIIPFCFWRKSILICLQHLPFNPISAELLPHQLSFLFHVTPSCSISFFNKPGNIPKSQYILVCLYHAVHLILHLLFLCVLHFYYDFHHHPRSTGYKTDIFYTHMNPFAKVWSNVQPQSFLIRPSIFIRPIYSKQTSRFPKSAICPESILLSYCE